MEGLLGFECNENPKVRRAAGGFRLAEFTSMSFCVMINIFWFGFWRRFWRLFWRHYTPLLLVTEYCKKYGFGTI